MRPPRWLAWGGGGEHGPYEERLRGTLAEPGEGEPSKKLLPLCSPFGAGCRAQPCVYHHGRAARPGHVADAAGSDATGRNAKP